MEAIIVFYASTLKRRLLPLAIPQQTPRSLAPPVPVHALRATVLARQGPRHHEQEVREPVQVDHERRVDCLGRRQTYRLGQHIASRFKTAKAQASVRIWPDPTGMYAAPGSINGVPVQFLIDTGATQVAMNKNEARRLGIEYARTGIEAAVHTASGITRSYQITLREVRVGDIVLAAVPASIIDGDFPKQLLLGNSFLNRIEMRRDGEMTELRKK